MRETQGRAEMVARRAWEAWKHDVETGDPEPLVSMMTEDYEFMFPNPTERFRGALYGKDEYRATSRWRWNDLGMRAKLELDGVTGSGGTWAFEWSIVSKNRGRPYTNHMCIFFDVRGEGVSAHREYVNELHPAAIANGAIEPSDAPPRRWR